MHKPERDRPERDHDIEVVFKGKADQVTSTLIDKRDASAPHPHVVGCVGCRRAYTCHACGLPVAPMGSAVAARCHSGACGPCCKKLHQPHAATCSCGACCGARGVA